MTEQVSPIPSVSPLSTLQVVTGTDVGLRREENQDSFGVIEGEGFRFYLVADGMGGVKGGAIASSLAVATVRDHLAKAKDLTPEILSDAVRAANDAIYQRGCSEEGMHGMGTTMVGLGFVGTSLILLNVGDSRAYRIRKESIEQLTDDHTLVRELVRSGAITEEQAKNHPVSHMLTRSLGPTLELTIDCAFSVVPPARGDKFLLCSDGLYNLVQPDEIALIVTAMPFDAAVPKLISLANERGGTDNITVVIVEAGEGYPDAVTVTPSKDEASAVTIAGETPASSSSTAVHVEPVTAASDSTFRVESDVTSSAEEIAPDALPKEHRFNRLQALLLGIFGVGILVGALSGYVFKKPEPSDAAVPAVPHPVAGQLAPVRSGLGGDPVAPIELQAPVLIVRQPGEEGSPSDSSASVMVPSGQTQEDGIEARKRAIEKKLARLAIQIEAVDKPLDGSLLSMLGQSDERDALQSKLENLLRELETETRRLSVWVGRRTRLVTTDPVDLASEIAAASPLVKEGKESFEKASWDYLREVEVFRYSPHDEKLQEKISDLARVRGQKIEELSQAVVSTVNGEIDSSNQRIAAITSERDFLEQELSAMEREMDFAKLLTSGDQGAKAQKKQDLIRERDLLTAELRDLR